MDIGGGSLNGRGLNALFLIANDLSTRPLHGQVPPQGYSRNSTSLRDLGIGLASSLELPITAPTLQNIAAASNLQPSSFLKLGYSDLIGRNSQLQQVQADLMSRTANQNPQLLVNSHNSTFTGGLARRIPEEDNVNVLEPPMKRQKQDPTSGDASVDTKGTIFVASLTPAERQASFPIAPLPGKQQKSKNPFRLGSLAGFRKTWAQLDGLIGKDIQGEERKKLLSELFTRHLKTQDGTSRMYRKIHGLDASR